MDLGFTTGWERETDEHSRYLQSLGERPTCRAPSAEVQQHSTGSARWEGASWGRGAAAGSLQRSEEGSPEQQGESASGKGSG